MYQNTAAGYKFGISETNIHCQRNDCNLVFLAKQKPAALWELRSDNTYK